MQEPEVTPYPGVQRRPNTTFWHFYQTVPTDLARRFKDQWAERCSLRTRDLREANALAKQKAADWERTFAAMRLEDNPQEVTLSPSLVASVVAEVRRWVLEADDNFRSFHGGPQALVDREARRQLLAQLPTAAPSLTIPTPAPAAPPPDPLAGMSEAQADALARFNADTSAAAGRDLQRGNLKEAHALAVAVSKSLGWQADWLTTEGRKGLHEVLKAERAARADVLRRDAGEVVDTPPQQTANPQPQAPAHFGGLTITAIRQIQGLDIEAGKQTLSELFSAYYAAHRTAWKDWEDRIGRDYGPVMQTTIAALGDVQIETLNLSHIGRVVDRFKADAQRKGLKSGTLSKTHSRLAAVLRWAAGKRLLPDLTPPLKDLEVQHESYEAFTADELKALFGAGYPPTGFHRASKFWIPLLGLCTGARVEELAAIKLEHVGPDPDGGDVTGILLSPEGKVTGKNTESRRFVPLHPALIEAGFLRYLDALKDEGHSDLFPCIGGGARDGKGKTGTRDFADHRRAVGIGSAEGEGRGLKTFHSFRATLITAMGKAGVTGDVRRSIVGHARLDVHDGTYFQGEIPAPAKLDALCKVHFDLAIPVWVDSPEQQAARKPSTTSEGTK